MELFYTENPLLFWTIVAITSVIYCSFLNSLSKLIGSIDQYTRTIEPWMVWLMLVPLVNIFWQFALVTRLSYSIRKEFDGRNRILYDERPGFDIGLLMCLFNTVAVFSFYAKVLALVPVVFWIAYWVKMSYYKKLLQQPKPFKPKGARSSNVESDLEAFRERLE